MRLFGLVGMRLLGLCLVMEPTNELHSTTRAALSLKIKGLKTRDQLDAMVDTLVRHYDNGTLSVRGLSQLDDMVMVRLGRLTG